MLFTDGNFVTSADLQVIDGEFTDVATQENVIVDTSTSSLLTRSLSELGMDFSSHFQNFSGYLLGIGANSNYVAAVLNVLSTAINRPRAFLNQVVVQEPNPTKLPVKRWAEYFCLHAFYRSVFHRRLKDRYEKKMIMYEQERKRAWQHLKGLGCPIIMTPLPAPGATLEYGAGTWNSANVSATGSGSSDPGTTYQIAVTWVSVPPYVSSTNQALGESAGSQILSLAVPIGKFVHIDITSLTPPNGTIPVAIGTADVMYSPMSASGWNLYIGAATGPLYLQNATPIPVATKTQTLASTPSLSGAVLNAGQPAQYNFSFQNMVWRA